MQARLLAQLSCASLLGLVITLSACSQKELKHFAKQTAHNIGCDQNYENMHRRDQLRDDCLENRPK